MALASSSTATGRIYSNERPSILRVLEGYLDAMLGCVEGLKVLLVDTDTRVALNLVTTHTGLLRHEVVFVDVLETADRPDLRFLPAVVIARPTPEAVKAVSHALLEAKFREFHLFWTNIVDTDLLQALTNADEKSLVKRFEEMYFDMLPIVDDTCLIRLGAGTAATRAKLPLVMTDWSNTDFTRVCQGLVATMLASNRRPVIRYRNNSKVAARIASEVGSKMRMINTTFFDLRNRGSVLLILERTDDPLTPLLTPWTYESMVHENFGIYDGVVDVQHPGKGAQATPADATAADTRDVLSAAHDNFFAANRESDWGELCTSVRDLIEAYKSLHSIDLATASLTDIKGFMEKFPEAKTQSTIMTRHATIVGKLGDIVLGRNLCDISTVEQELACGPASPNDHAKLVIDAILEHPEGKPDSFLFDVDDVLRLVMLYCVRYEGGGGKTTADVHINEMKDALTNARGATAQHMTLLDKYVRFGAASNRICPLYPKNPGLLKNMVKAIGGFGGEVKNVLTQHTPLLKRLVCQAINGTLPTDQYPIQTASQGQVTGTTRFNDIIVFIAGGAAYEESRLVARINRGVVENDPTTFPPGAEVVGGTNQPAAADGHSPEPRSATILGGAVVGGAVVFNAGRALASRLTGTGPGPAEEEMATSQSNSVTKMMECHVTLVANGMLRSQEFLEALP
jgi:vacuolar protein sorting-associated protein 45